MAHLLGSRTCIDSLRVDVDDLQTVIYDIVGKTGSLKCHSWKFPDKLATDVEIKELLERYQYGKNELDNQVSHVILFEIIIDRLLLVIHGSWHFLHEIQTKLLPNTIDTSSTVNLYTSLSVGLVVKKYWNKLLHLFSLFQQQKHESNRKRSTHQVSLPIQTKSNLTYIDKHIQTVETSLGSCLSCIKYQQYLQNSSNNLIDLCHLYNLPSSLAHHRCSTSITCESFDDMNNWFDCKSKDFDRLSKHLEYLNTKLNKTLIDLNQYENNCKQLNEKNQNLQQILNNEKESKRKLEEFYENKLNEMKKENDQYQFNLNEKIKLLTTEKIQFEQNFKKLSEECALKEEQIEQLESSKNELKVLIDERIKSNALIKTFEDNQIRLQTEIDVVKRDLEERNRDLYKERMRIENMIRIEENSQSKQNLLIKSNEEFINECESLKKKISELEFERNALQKLLQTPKQFSSDTTKVESFVDTNHHVLHEVTSLKSTIEQLQQQLQQMNKREKLLTDSKTNDSMTNSISVSNNFLIDMQNQMRTNEHHMELLKKENEELKSSLEKFQTQHLTILSSVPEERQISFTNEIQSSKPKQSALWLLNNEIIEQQQQQQQMFKDKKSSTEKNPMSRVSENNYAVHRWIKSDQDVNIEILSQSNIHTTMERIHPTDSIIDSRPPIPNHLSHNRTPSIPQRIDHDMALAKVELITLNRPLPLNKTRPLSSNDNTRRDNSISKNSSRNLSSAKTQRSPTRTIHHQCTICHRTFDEKRNYDIHKLYCRT